MYEWYNFIGYTFELIAPLSGLVIDGQSNGSVVVAEMAVTLTLTCRVGCSKPPFALTWTKKQHGIPINIRRGIG